MKYGLDIPTVGTYANPHKLADLAAEAEQAGWDGFFVWDLFLGKDGSAEPVVDPWMALAAIAMQTQHIRIGALVTPLARRRPWQLARETVALDHLSHGRLIFGAGLGWQPHDFAAFGEEVDLKIRAEKLDEGLAVMSGLWTGEPLNFQGKHYQVHGVTLLPKPLQAPRIPVWLAGGWPNRKPLRRAARWDGIYLMTVNQLTDELLTPAEVREIVAYLRTHREGSDPFDVAMNGETPADPHKGTEIVQPYIEAGATWWVEYEASRETFEEYRQRIGQGPPRALLG